MTAPSHAVLVIGGIAPAAVQQRNAAVERRITAGAQSPAAVRDVGVVMVIRTTALKRPSGRAARG